MYSLKLPNIANINIIVKVDSSNSSQFNICSKTHIYRFTVHTANAFQFNSILTYIVQNLSHITDIGGFFGHL